MVFRSIKYRRFSAIFLDLLLLSLLTSLLFNNSISNPRYNDYQNYSKEYTELITNINIEDYSSPDKVVEFKDKVSTLLYNTQKSNLFYYIWFVVLSILYFVIFQYSTGGKTLGKKLYGLKVVDSENKKKISLSRLIGRTLFAGELFLFDGIVFTCILNIIGILLINDSNIYFYYNALINLIGIIFEIVLIVTFFKNKNNETITDKVFKTKVIDIK
jgi:uncharacterized RDD family membrane protein YckC